MTQKWNTRAYAIPTGSTLFSDRATDHTDGISTALTRFYGASDPSSGEGWGADELGYTWVDSTNSVEGSGDDLGAVVKVWMVLTDAPTYGWRTRNAWAYIALEPNVNALNLSDQGTTGFTDLDLNAETSDRAVAALLQVEVQDDGTPSASVYAELRKNGTTTDVRSRRIYPQVTDIPVMQQFVVELDSAQVCEYAINAGTQFDLRVDVLGYYERAE